MTLADLPEHLLMESYKQAIKLELGPEFIALLQKEIERRNFNNVSLQKQSNSKGI